MNQTWVENSKNYPKPYFSDIRVFFAFHTRVRLQILLMHASSHAGIHGDAREVAHSNPDKDRAPQVRLPETSNPNSPAVLSQEYRFSGRIHASGNTQ